MILNSSVRREGGYYGPATRALPSQSASSAPPPLQLAAQNQTGLEVWAECNVILLPLAFFFLLCLIVIYVLCKYKICGSEPVEKAKTSNDGNS